MEHLGIDVHQKYSDICGVSESGEIVLRRRIATTEASLRRALGGRSRARVLIECGPLTPWVYRLIGELGHEVVVVNSRRVRLIAESTLKTDTLDAEVLARWDAWTWVFCDRCTSEAWQAKSYALGCGFACRWSKHARL